jgi:hypothetical protein
LAEGDDEPQPAITIAANPAAQARAAPLPAASVTRG